MKQPESNVVGTVDARTHLSRLLDRVEKGETIVIKRHGEPVAKLVPFAEGFDVARVAKTVRKIKRFAKGRHVSDMEIRQSIEEGRRF